MPRRRDPNTPVRAAPGTAGVPRLIHFPKELWAAIEAAAEHEKVSVPEWLRAVVRAALP